MGVKNWVNIVLKKKKNSDIKWQLMGRYTKFIGKG